MAAGGRGDVPGQATSQGHAYDRRVGDMIAGGDISCSVPWKGVATPGSDVGSCLADPSLATTSRVRRQDLTLPPQVESVPAARHFLKLQLREWGLQAASDTVEIAASELLTNAVVHARTSFDVTIILDDNLTVSVRDTGGCFPRELRTGTEELELPPWDREGGRGLALVAAITDGWGLTANDSSTTVWFHVRLPQT